MKSILPVVLLLISTSAIAQFFVQKLPQDQALQNDQAYVITNAGDSLSGRLSQNSLVDGRIRSLTIKGDGQTQKFKVTDITRLGIMPSVMARFTEMPILTTLKNASDTSFLGDVQTDWVVYDKVLLPGRRERYELSQLLNPGFDQKIKVYESRFTGSTMEISSGSMKLAGGLDDSHLIVIESTRPFNVRKRKYKEEGYSNLFSNCEKMNEVEPDWKDFAKHIYQHYKLCQ